MRFMHVKKYSLMSARATIVDVPDIKMALSKHRWSKLPHLRDNLHCREAQLCFPPLCYPSLAKAARENDLDLLCELIELGRDVDEEDSSGQTALHHAAEEGNIKAIVALLQAGADRTIEDERGFTPLHGAAHESQPDSVKCLLHQHLTADVEQNKEQRLNVVNRRGASERAPLHWAAFRSSRETVLELLRGGANVHCSVSENNSRIMPIHVAASNKFGGPSVIRLLLDWGANVDSIDEQLFTPLVLAVIYCNVNAVKELLAASADVNISTDLQPALIRTAQALNVGVAAPTYIPGYFRSKFLRNYSRIDYLLILKLLLSVPSIRINQCDIKSGTALHYAAEANSVQGVKLLLEHGAEPEIGNLLGQMPVDLTKSDEIGSLLRNFKRGANVIAYNDAQIQESPLVGISRKKATLITQEGSEIILQADSANSVKVVIPKKAISSEATLVLQVSMTPSPAVLDVHLGRFQERQGSRELAMSPKEAKAMSNVVARKIDEGEVTLLEDASSVSHLVMSSDPVDGDGTETVISPYITITSSRCAEFNQRVWVELPHSVETVDKSVQVNVKSQKLSSDGCSLTPWDKVPNEDVECNAETVTVQMDSVVDAVGVVAVAKSMSGEPIPKKVQLQIVGTPQLKTNTEVYAVLSTNAYTADGFQSLVRGQFEPVNLKEWMSLPEEIVCSVVDIDVGMRAGEPAFFSPENRLVRKSLFTSSDALHRVRFLLECRSEPVRSIACHCVLKHGDCEDDTCIPFATPEPAMSVKRLLAVEEKSSGIDSYVDTPLSRIMSIIDVDVIDVVARFCSDKWEDIGMALGYSQAHVANFVSTSERPSNYLKLTKVISGWVTDKGKHATVGKLLEACDRVQMRGGVEEKIETLMS